MHILEPFFIMLLKDFFLFPFYFVALVFVWILHGECYPWICIFTYCQLFVMGDYQNSCTRTYFDVLLCLVILMLTVSNFLWCTRKIFLLKFLALNVNIDVKLLNQLLTLLTYCIANLLIYIYVLIEQVTEIPYYACIREYSLNKSNRR